MSSGDKEYSGSLRWIESQSGEMRGLVEEWSRINTHAYNLPGLREMAAGLRRSFAHLGGEMEEIPLPPHRTLDEDGAPCTRELGPMLLVRKRSRNPVQVLLGIHMDTVYDEHHSFREVSRPGEGILQGPGVTDAKGGIAVMLKALEAFERSPIAERLGWRVFINPDEEINSPGSSEKLAELAGTADIGLLFEPAFDDGSLVSARRGTGGFTVIIRGKAAHAGREPEKGRSAVNLLARFIQEINTLNGAGDGILLNVGRIRGGEAVNVIPEFARADFMARVWNDADVRLVEERLADLVARLGGEDGVSAELHGSFSKPPKTYTPEVELLLGQIAGCGRDLGLQLDWMPSSGASDGNTLAAAGLPTLDSLGPRGGGMHSSGEFVRLESLVERAQLTALLLMKIAAGELDLERISPRKKRMEV